MLYKALTLIAIVAGPVVAILVNRYLQRRKDRKEQKKRIFKQLMKDRKFVLSSGYEEAMSLICVEFDACRGIEVDIRDCYQMCLNHVKNTHYRNRDEAAWYNEMIKRLTSLICLIAKSLEYNVGRAEVEGGFPQGLY